MTDRQLVVDASVLAQIYVKDEEEQFAYIAEGIVRQYVDGSLDLVAPQVILYEIPSAIHRAVRRRRLSPNDARMAIRHFFNLGVRTLGTDGNLERLIESAYMRATQLGCHIYDALYLVVAEVLGYRFVTADRKLYQAIHSRVDYVLWIADYELDGGPPP